MFTTMALQGALAVLLKDADGREAYEAVLAPLLPPVFVPVLSFQSQLRERLTEALSDFEQRYSRLILTSQRAAAELLEAANALYAHGAQLSHTCYAVGKKTASLLSTRFSHVLGEGAGSAEALADLIIRDVRGGNGDQHSTGSSITTDGAKKHAHNKAVPLLFLCGDKRLDVLPTKLTAAGLAFQELQVYRSAPADPADVWARVLAAIQARISGPDANELSQADNSERMNAAPVVTAAAGSHPSTAFLVLFSPSGFATLMGHPPAAAALKEGTLSLQAESMGSGRNENAIALQLIALGQTTAAAIRGAGIDLPDDAICATPDPQGVADAIHRMSERRTL